MSYVQHTAAIHKIDLILQDEQDEQDEQDGFGESNSILLILSILFEFLLGFQKVLRDHDPLDLAGAFADGAEF